MNLPVKPWLDAVGKFTVEHIGGIPHFNQPVDLAAPRSAVLHTTEGSTIEGAMGVFRQHFAPHFVLGKSTDGGVKILQLVQIGTIGAALVTHNDHAIVQVEMAGFSKETPWLPDDETADALASLMAACQREYGIPLTHPWADGDFGLAGDNKHRSAGKWGVVAGWYGHGDCPMPDTHWDPGALEWSKIFARAAAMTDETSAAPWTPPAEPARPCACHPAPPAPAAPLVRDTSWVQATLNKLGATPRLVVDGETGPNTLTGAAIARFQGANNLYIDGIAGKDTIAALEKAS